MDFQERNSRSKPAPLALGEMSLKRRQGNQPQHIPRRKLKEKKQVWLWEKVGKQDFEGKAGKNALKQQLFLGVNQHSDWREKKKRE